MSEAYHEIVAVDHLALSSSPGKTRSPDEEGDAQSSSTTNSLRFLPHISLWTREVDESQSLDFLSSRPAETGESSSLPNQIRACVICGILVPLLSLNPRGGRPAAFRCRAGKTLRRRERGTIPTQNGGMWTPRHHHIRRRSAQKEQGLQACNLTLGRSRTVRRQKAPGHLRHRSRATSDRLATSPSFRLKWEWKGRDLAGYGRSSTSCVTLDAHRGRAGPVQSRPGGSRSVALQHG